MNSFSQGTQLPSIPRPQLRAIVERDLPTVLGLPIAPSVSNEIPSSQPLPSSEA